jgi:hypothetical protein
MSKQEGQVGTTVCAGRVMVVVVAVNVRVEGGTNTSSANANPYSVVEHTHRHPHPMGGQVPQPEDMGKKGGLALRQHEHGYHHTGRKCGAVGSARNPPPPI